MQFQDLNWFDVQNYLQNDDRLMLVIGSCEQHGYLSLQTDVKIPKALADAASQQTGVLVAPAVNFGFSPYFMAYPGTLSLRTTTLMDLLEDLVRSAYRHGFRRLLVLNGHGGNEPAQARLYELANQLSDLMVVWYAWWNSHSVETIAAKYELKPAHANWFEAFSFTKVADLPSGGKAPPHVQGLVGADAARQIYGDGVFGGPYSVDGDIMHEVFAAALQDVLVKLQFQ
jgi:creatinine amidohydrolase